MQNEIGRGIASDVSGNTYVIGNTEGSLGGANAGGADAFVTKLDPQGNLLWAKQFGTNARDNVEEIILDHLGNLYVSGDTPGLVGASHFGGRDAFVAKINTNGDMVWIHQFGTSSDENVGGLYVDALGDVYVSGHTVGNLGGTSAGSWDAFVIRIRSVPEPSSIFLIFLGQLGWITNRSRLRVTSTQVGVFQRRR